MQYAQPQYVQAPQGGVRYVQAAPQYVQQQASTTQLPVQYVQGGQVTYAAPQPQVTYGAPQVTYAAQPQVTYAAQQAPTVYAAPAQSAALRTVAAPTVVRAAAAPVEQAWRVKLGAEMPNFHCNTTHGDFTFHEFLDSDPQSPFTILFSHPKDFTPVCTTELGRCEQLVPDFQQRGVKLIGVSCDPVEEHRAWTGDILHREQLQADSLSFPIIADSNRDIVVQLGMLDPDEQDAAGVPLPARALIVIGPDKKVKLSILYPATTGRNFDEVIRVVDSLQLTAGMGLATPADWRQGERCIVAPVVSTEDAQARFTNLEIEELPSGKQYLRTVDCPQ